MPLLNTAFDNTSPDPVPGRVWAPQTFEAKTVATAAVTIASDMRGQTANGYVLAEDDYILLTFQGSALFHAANGLYKVGAAALTRAPEMAHAHQFIYGNRVRITAGTLIGSEYVQDEPGGANTTVVDTTQVGFSPTLGTQIAPTAKTPSTATAFDNTAPTAISS